jgi:hypothetical protein
MKLKWRYVAALAGVMAVCFTAAGQRGKEKTLMQLYEESLVRPDGKDSFGYMKGYAYAFIPGQRPQKLFGIEGYNVRRRIETPEKDGYFIATREVVFYTDANTGQIIWEWDNPFTGKKDEVFHISNDPVNFRVRIRDGKHISVSLDGKREFGEPSPPQEWDDYYVFHSDVFPFYPLPGWDKNYTAAELFDTYISKADRYRDGPAKVMTSWTRVGPWLPWLRMDGHEGVMVYHARSDRLASWDQLPAHIRQVVKEKYPIYLTAPDRVDPTRPNVTSWTYYMEEMKKRKSQ